MTSIDTISSVIHHEDASDPQEFSLYGTEVSSIIQIPELSQINNTQNINTVRIMHSLNLKSMQVKLQVKELEYLI